MAKFNPGDVVRRIDHDYREYRVGTIRTVKTNYNYSFAFTDGTEGSDPQFWELVKPASPEIWRVFSVNKTGNLGPSFATRAEALDYAKQVLQPGRSTYVAQIIFTDEVMLAPPTPPSIVVKDLTQ